MKAVLSKDQQKSRLGCIDVSALHSGAVAKLAINKKLSGASTNKSSAAMPCRCGSLLRCTV